MKTKKSKPKELVISTAERSKLSMSVMNKALKVANTANKDKIAIRVEKTYPGIVIWICRLLIFDQKLHK
jgi:hypothetical protein